MLGGRGGGGEGGGGEGGMRPVVMILPPNSHSPTSQILSIPVVRVNMQVPSYTPGVLVED